MRFNELELFLAARIELLQLDRLLWTSQNAEATPDAHGRGRIRHLVGCLLLEDLTGTCE